LKMRFVEVKNAGSKPNPHGVDARNISDTKNVQVVHITLKPGEALKKHITPVDVFFYILEGQITVEIGDERVVVGPETLVESPAKIPHRLANEGTGVGRILVVKTPKPNRSN
jgi:mannose-6-phosphate isomerase-like protein (cupin superfamily)